MKMSIAVFLCSIGLCMIGGWQTFEHFQQDVVYEDLNTRLAMKPVTLHDLMKEPRENWAYRHVTTAAHPTNGFFYVAADRSKGIAKDFTALEFERSGTMIIGDLGYAKWPRPPIKLGKFSDMKVSLDDLDDFAHPIGFNGVILPSVSSGPLDHVPATPFGSDYFDVPDIDAMIDQIPIDIVRGIYLFVESPKSPGHELGPFVLEKPDTYFINAAICFVLAAMLALGFLILRPRENQDTRQNYNF